MYTYERPILIASSTTDRQTYTGVLEELSRLGHETVLYESDDVISGKAKFVAEIDDSGQLNVQYNNITRRDPVSRM